MTDAFKEFNEYMPTKLLLQINVTVEEKERKREKD